MTKRIYKYEIMDHAGRQPPGGILMPRSAIPLAVGMQAGSLMLWAKVDDVDDSETTRRIEVFGTGHSVPERFTNHLGTCQDERGFVWHVLEAPWG